MASTTTSTALQATGQASWAATVAIAGSAYFALAIAALHFLRPGLSPVSHFTSEYANGSYGFLMTSAFFSMFLATAALVVGLYQRMPQQALSRTGLVFLGLWGIGVAIAMTFPIDAEGAPVTLSGTIHQSAGPLTFLCASIGVTLLSLRFGHDENWRPLQRVALVLSLVIAAGFVATAYNFFTGGEFGGLMQRIVLATIVMWMLLIAARLRSPVLA